MKPLPAESVVASYQCCSTGRSLRLDSDSSRTSISRAGTGEAPQPGCVSCLLQFHKSKRKSPATVQAYRGRGWTASLATCRDWANRSCPDRRRVCGVSLSAKNAPISDAHFRSHCRRQESGDKRLGAQFVRRPRSLEVAAPHSFRLVDTPAQDADVVVEVAAAIELQKPKASLVLRTAGDRSLLWSKDFQRPSGSLGDVRPEIVNSAALILGCVQDALSDAEPLKTEVLKIYLGGCWGQLGPDGSDPSLTDTFLNVTRQAPRFEPAWARLLFVESQTAMAAATGQEGVNIRRSLRSHIDQARRVNPRLAEISLAEAALVAPTNVVGRMRLVNQAVEQDPHDAMALVQQAYDWTAVGRMTDAVRTAYSAVQVEPFSPMVRDAHVFTLQNAGQLDRARHETEQMALIWPNAMQLWFMRIRSADPATVLKLMQSSSSWADKQVEDWI